ncbi:MAG: hypothetical protein NDJ94_00255 [Vicinamibacteria bacterium]|nr:hypothetical protein [Vicinamibacteria bacterium]
MVASSAPRVPAPAPDTGPSEAARREMVQRVLEVGALSAFVLRLRDAVRRRPSP